MKATVLVVDDSALARRSTRRILEEADYRVIEAEDGLSALERYSLERPAVVLLDLVMKGMYGVDVLASLREIDPEAKVIVISADVQTSSRDLVREAGAAGFLTKPMDAAQVLESIRQVLAGEERPWS